MSDALLQTQQLRKEFGGLVANDDVDFVVPRGSIVSLIGPNGAGKTTFFNMLTGVYTPTSGEVTFDGHEVVGLPPHAVTHLGVGRTFQNIRLFPTMTGLENVLVGMHSRLRPGVRRTERMMPPLIRECMPTSTFSRLVIVGKRRMFWNVRPTPRCVTVCGGSPATSRPSNRISPLVGV